MLLVESNKFQFEISSDIRSTQTRLMYTHNLLMSFCFMNISEVGTTWDDEEKKRIKIFCCCCSLAHVDITVGLNGKYLKWFSRININFHHFEIVEINTQKNFNVEREKRGKNPFLRIKYIFMYKNQIRVTKVGDWNALNSQQLWWVVQVWQEAKWNKFWGNKVSRERELN